jgi:hypothetical protein
VVLIRTDVSEELITSIIRAERISELGTLAVNSSRSALRRNRSVLQLLVSAKVVPSSPILSILLLFLRSVLQLLVTANVVPSSLILSI